MFENVDGRTTDDGQTTDARVTGILIAHLGAFGSGELKNEIQFKHIFGSVFGFGVYVKSLIGFNAFYFVCSVSVYSKTCLKRSPEKRTKNWFSMPTMA